MNSPHENPGPTLPPLLPPDSQDKGTILNGFFAGWAVIIISSLLAWVLLVASRGISTWHTPVAGLLGLIIYYLPPISLIALVIWYAHQGKRRSALGVLVAVGSVFAVAALLVAACFGVVMFGLHNGTLK